ncbi:MAG: hypothetical protein FWD71_22510 [Oscillospiraceae bacterium]|nr:hypothetical protein [Oscillospiraceae bacterium]
MGLFKPAWMNEEQNKALEAIGKLSNQVELAKAVKDAPVWKVKVEAVKKITDKTLLADIAKNAVKEYLRQLAVERIIDQTLLIDIAKNDNDADVRITAALNISDNIISQQIFADILTGNSGMSDLREQALSKVEDQDVLEYVALNKKESITCRELAIGKLTNMAVIDKIAKDTSNDLIIRGYAIEKTSTQSLLASIAQNGDVQIRVKAADRLEDRDVAQQTYIAVIKKLLSDKNLRYTQGSWETREKLVRKITDQAALIDVTSNRDEVPLVRMAAADKLTDRDLAHKIYSGLINTTLPASVYAEIKSRIDSSK